MNRKYRKVYIIGNWKMNGTPAQLKEFGEALRESCGKIRNCEMAICVAFPLISAAEKVFRSTHIAVGAQNMSEHASGAYTGEVSARQLLETGVKYVILGHSERRQLFGEDDFTVNRKLLAALEAGLTPILCLGETQEERERGLTEARVEYQLKAALYGTDAAALRRCVIAYEPIWAIGSGKNAKPEEAQAVCEFLRSRIRAAYGALTARAVPILYGGSMNAENAASLLAQPDIDGGLIGTASLDAEEFSQMIKTTRQELQ